MNSQIKNKAVYWGTGRRKTSVARVRLIPGNGIIKINGVEIINDWSGLHPPAHRYSGWRTLVGGQSYSYERLFSEWGGGAVLRQEWYIWGLHGWKYMNIGNDFE